MSRSFDTPCTIRVAHSGAELHAHVDLDGDVELGPGDRVLVHGAPVTLRFGQSLELRRTATVTRATTLERLWTKVAAHFDLTELYEVSFSPGAIR